MTRQEITVVGLLAIAGLGGAGFAVDYALGAQTQIEAGCLTIALAALAAALVVWEHELMSHSVAIEQRGTLRSGRDARREAGVAAVGAVETVVGRRSWLVKILVGVVGIVGIGALFPLRSLTPKLGDRLRTTAWKDGSKLVRVDGTPVKASDLEVDSIITVFPEGHTGPDDTFVMANSATVLIRVPPEELELPPDRVAGAPQGLIAFSKVCTHAGCPVALYRAAARQLFCPCHQSTFDVLRGGKRIFGPAVRPLEQLPIRIAGDGTVTATGDFPGPIGPGYWERG